MLTNLTSNRRIDSARHMGSPQLALTTQITVHRPGLPATARFRQWARAALIESADVTLRLVDHDEGLTLNSMYRNRHYATNVLTFAYPETSPLSGDIVLCLPVIEQEAQEQGKTFEAHLAHLTVHGMLHLQGFDHETEEDAELMEGLETEILSGLGYPDPYAETVA